MSQDPSEQDLIEAYRRTVKPLYAYVSRRVAGDASLAEDLVQDTWMQAVGSWRAKGIPDDPLAWLVRVARNTLVSHFRHRGLEVEADLRRSALARRIDFARRQVEDLKARINVGTANPLNLAEAELRVQELQLKMSKVGYELLLIRRQLGK